MKIELQGHRGARGLKPENSLPALETAFDLGVSSVEVDLRWTQDASVVLFHDAAISPDICRLVPGAAGPNPAERSLVSQLTLEQLRSIRCDRNPDPKRFPLQENSCTPLVSLVCADWGIDPYTPIQLEEMFRFAKVYAGPLGERAGKSPRQRERVCAIRFDLELKAMPFRPEQMRIQGNEDSAIQLAKAVIQLVHAHDMTTRTTIRCFDHRAVLAVNEVDPVVRTAVLIADTAPVSPVMLTHAAKASMYCPSVDFLRQHDVRELHDAGIRVMPWTVNAPADWQRLLDWGVDGITTDFPDRLAEFLKARNVDF